MPTVPEIRLFSPGGERLYLNEQERADFLSALTEEGSKERLYCQVLHYTGCRPSEALQLVPSRISIDESSLIFRSLKKRKIDSKGNEKAPQYRIVPIPSVLTEHLDLVFEIRAKLRERRGINRPLWDMSRTTAYRLVKRVIARAGIKGKQAIGKGLRHGFGIAMVTAKKPLPIHVLSKLMGHSNSEMTEIYLQVVGEEQRGLVMDAWDIR